MKAEIEETRKRTAEFKVREGKLFLILRSPVDERFVKVEEYEFTNSFKDFMDILGQWKPV